MHIRRLCKKLFDEFIHEKLVQVEKNEDISGLIDDILDNTLFVGLGNDSESGNNILYYFRQENGLSKTNFEIRTGKTYDNLVYIDDLSISGDQALEYMESRSISANHVYSAILISTEDALKRIRESSMDVKPITAVILDNRDRAFSNLSYVFSDSRMNPIRLCAKDFCEYYGKIAVEKDGYMSNYPLGYSDGKYLIGFEYNTPDNTLPIFWGYKNGWKPLFKRYPKKYEGEEYTLDGRKYY